LTRENDREIDFISSKQLSLKRLSPQLREKKELSRGKRGGERNWKGKKIRGGGGVEKRGTSPGLPQDPLVKAINFPSHMRPMAQHYWWTRRGKGRLQMVEHK